jgi:hypothetical protein
MNEQGTWVKITNADEVKVGDRVRYSNHSGVKFGYAAINPRHIIYIRRTHADTERATDLFDGNWKNIEVFRAGQAESSGDSAKPESDCAKCIGDPNAEYPLDECGACNRYPHHGCGVYAKFVDWLERRGERMTLEQEACAKNVLGEWQFLASPTSAIGKTWLLHRLNEFDKSGVASMPKNEGGES